MRRSFLVGTLMVLLCASRGFGAFAGTMLSASDAANQIRKFNPATNSFDLFFNVDGVDSGTGRQLREPKRAVLGPDGKLYVVGAASTTGSTVQSLGGVARYNFATGAFEGMVIPPGPHGETNDIAISPLDGMIYMTDYTNAHIWRFDLNGNRDTGFAISTAGNLQPYAMIFDPQGRLLVAESGANRISRYTLSATGGTRTVLATVNNCLGLALAPDGALYAAAGPIGSVVVKLLPNASGGFNGPDVFATGGNDTEIGLAIDNDANLWASSLRPNGAGTNSIIFKYDAAGTLLNGAGYGLGAPGGFHLTYVNVPEPAAGMVVMGLAALLQRFRPR